MIDLHIHSNNSDGTDSPEELLKKIREKGINIFALTDHDNINGVRAMRKLITPDIKFIEGIEFSCKCGNFKCHILGLGYDENDKVFQDALTEGENLRHEKFFKRINFLRENFNIEFSDEEINTLSKIPGVGKPHLGNLIVSKGFAATRVEAMENFVDKCKTGSYKIEAETAIKAINSSGGISVWAHPLGGEREEELSQEEFFYRLKILMSFGLKGLECFYSKYEIEKCKWLSNVAKDNNLYVSGGSDYHGSNKNIPLAKLNAENIKISDENLTVLERLI